MVSIQIASDLHIECIDNDDVDPLDFIKNTYIGCDIYDRKYYGFKNGSTSTEEQRDESVEPSE